MSAPQLPLKEQAMEVIVRERIKHFCQHTGHCMCRSKLRGSAWQSVDALVRAGWKLLPPPLPQGQSHTAKDHS